MVVDANETTKDLLESLNVEDEEYNITCKSGIKGAKFDVPSDIEFVDFNEIYNHKIY